MSSSKKGISVSLSLSLGFLFCFSQGFFFFIWLKEFNTRREEREKERKKEMPKSAQQGRKKKDVGEQPYSLVEQLERDASLKPTKRRAKGADDDDERGEGEEAPLSAKMASKIMHVAHAQRVEEDGEAGASGSERDDSDDDDDDDGMGGDESETEEAYNAAPAMEVGEDDERALAAFQLGAGTDAGAARAPRKTLGEIIAEKMRESEAREAAEAAADGGMVNSMGDGGAAAQSRRERREAEKRVRALYTGVGEFLHRYTTGKLLKAFKVLPTLKNWEELLFLTRPDEWSPHAMRAAVRLFANSGNPKMTQRFFNIVLLPCIRDAIGSQKKIHFEHYMAIKNALYRPTCFFKGFLLPLCEAGDCTLKEAVIVSSVLAKCSIPMLHSSACIMKIAQMPYSGANSVFLRTLLDKKYSLPYRVVDAVVDHFTAFAKDERRMVVLWHQSLLIFAQRYKNDMTIDQKRRLLKLTQVHNHPLITPEIRYELEHSPSRDCATSIANGGNSSASSAAPTGDTATTAMN